MEAPCIKTRQCDVTPLHRAAVTCVNLPRLWHLKNTSEKSFRDNKLIQEPLLQTSSSIYPSSGRGWEGNPNCFSSPAVLVDSDLQHVAEPGCGHTASPSCRCFN